jgi:FKBP-type peptidyl-prolyl cis-trans isomerase SlyD
LKFNGIGFIQQEEMMLVTENSVVSFHFQLRDEKGQVLDETQEEAAQVLLGTGDIIAGLENALIGSKVGDKIELELPPDEAFGIYREELVSTLPLDEFPEIPEVGEEYVLNDESDAIPYAVTAIKGDEVHLDANHLYAGQRVFFSVEVVAVREPTAEEVAHGHVHNDDHEHHP